MLAKIGHGFAVAQWGLEGFKPLVPDVILRRSHRWFRYVGGRMTGTLLQPGERAHNVLRSGWWPTLGGMRLVVEVQLFANLGAPVYHVVVGDPAD
jgi:hypothetical protein